MHLSHSHHHHHSHELHRKPRHERSIPNTVKVNNDSATKRTSSRVVLLALVSVTFSRFFAFTKSNPIALAVTVASWLTLSNGVVSLLESLRKGTKSLCSNADGVTYLGMIVNALLSVSKAVVGLRCNSAVLVADAGHSLSDLLTDLLTLVFVRFGKYEAVGSLSLSCVLAGTGLSVGVASAKRLLRDGLSASSSSAVAAVSCVPALVVAGLSVASKEWLFRVTKKVGEESGSSVVVANAWHHRSDAFSSVLALVSVGLAAAFPSLQFLDAAAGLLVAAVIGKAGVDIAKDSLRSLFGKGERRPAQTDLDTSSEDDAKTSAKTTKVATWFESPEMETYSVLKSLEESLAVASPRRNMEIRAFVKSFEENVALGRDDAMLSSLPWLFDSEGNIIQNNEYVTTTINNRGTRTSWSASFLTPVEDKP